MDEIVSSDEILRRYAAGERDFSGLEIEDPVGAAPLQGASLDGADFSGTFLVVDLQRAGLRQARFVGANVKTWFFAGADLRGADFTDAALDATIFFGAQLEGARFEGAHIQGAVLRGSERPEG